MATPNRTGNVLSRPQNTCHWLTCCPTLTLMPLTLMLKQISILFGAASYMHIKFWFWYGLVGGQFIIDNLQHLSSKLKNHVFLLENSYIDCVWSGLWRHYSKELKICWVHTYVKMPDPLKSSVFLSYRWRFYHRAERLLCLNSFSKTGIKPHLTAWSKNKLHSSSCQKLL